MILPTTSVGSLPRDDYLIKARKDFREGELDETQYIEVVRKATRDWIKIQEQLGLDILVDGEFERDDMATFFAERLKGFEISGWVRSYGNRYYRKPVAVGKIEFIEPMALDIWKFAQGCTGRPVKAIFTGPYTMMDWSFNEYYPTRRAMLMELAEALSHELKALEKAGAKYIQIDEPALSVRPSEINDVIEAINLMTKDIRAKTIMHVCYGLFEKIYPKMLDINIDQFDLEFANRNYELLALFQKDKYTKEVGLGVTDVHNHRIETMDEIKAGISKAMSVIPVDKIYVGPDCGLKTRTPEEGKAKLKVMVDAVKELRMELDAQ
ncbi:methionine synthase [Candidatus Micrarchaeota archaeon CG08_land_8_20_14_0_20_49_17]|nr:MAG: methionine synthase [Candidatus Micrarchaeota archaeon CG08_land_8_20_14_0_20_49_17]HII53554.1 methionine synthase [Candidatus Micrarchaeota archaeon]